MTWSCQVCRHDAASHLVTQGAYEWLQCARCGFAALAELPSFEAARQLQDAAMGAVYIQDNMRKLASKLRRSRRRVRRLKRHMPGRRLLEIGANIGCFVEAARRLGLEAVGLEINPTLVAHARQAFPDNAFVCGTVEEAGFDAASFDGVYCAEVIEHLVDVNSFMSAISQAVRPGGSLFLTTPELARYITGPDVATWRSLVAPDHKLYFNRDNMAQFLQRHGFEQVRFLRNWNRKPGIKLLARRAAA